MAKAEGKTFDFLDETHIDPQLIEVFDFDSPEQYIKSETDEFSAVCPFSGLPDIAYVKIEYYLLRPFNDSLTSIIARRAYCLGGSPKTMCVCPYV